MSKSKRNFRRDDRDYEDGYVDRRDISRDRDHKKQKKLKNALHTRDIDSLMENDDD